MNLVSLPPLTQTPEDLECLTTLLLPACGPHAVPTTVSFAHCDFLTPTAVAYLGGLLRLAAIHHAPVTFDWTSLSLPLTQYLCRTGLLPLHGIGTPAHPGHAVPFREDPLTGPQPDLPRYLDSAWLDHPWLHLTALQRRLIVSRLLEIYTNACDHSGATVSICTAGQHYPRSRHLLLAILDFGRGIPESVRSFQQNPALSSCDALQWAFQRGNTTQPSRPRGLGLDLLASFIRSNRGRLDLISADAIMTVTAHQTQCHPLPYTFPGTAVCLSLRCEPTLYGSTTMPPLKF